MPTQQPILPVTYIVSGISVTANKKFIELSIAAYYDYNNLSGGTTGVLINNLLIPYERLNVHYIQNFDKDSEIVFASLIINNGDKTLLNLDTSYFNIDTDTKYTYSELQSIQATFASLAF